MYLPSLLGFAAVLVTAVSANHGGFSNSWSSNNGGGGGGGFFGGRGPIGNILSRWRQLSGSRPVRTWLIGNRGFGGNRFITFGENDGRGNGSGGGSRLNGGGSEGAEGEGGPEEGAIKFSWNSAYNGNRSFNSSDDEGHESDEHADEVTDYQNENEIHEKESNDQEEHKRIYDIGGQNENSGGLSRGGGRSAGSINRRQWSFNFKNGGFGREVLDNEKQNSDRLEGNCSKSNPDKFCPTCDEPQEEHCATCSAKQRGNGGQEKGSVTMSRSGGRSTGTIPGRQWSWNFKNGGIKSENYGEQNGHEEHEDPTHGEEKEEPGTKTEQKGHCPTCGRDEDKMCASCGNDQKGNTGISSRGNGRSVSQRNANDDDKIQDDNENGQDENHRGGMSSIGRWNNRLNTDRLRDGIVGRLFSRIRNVVDTENMNANRPKLLDRVRDGANNIGRLLDRVKNSARRGGGQAGKYNDDNGHDADENGDNKKKLLDRLFDRVKNASARSGGQQSDDDGHVNEYTDDIRNVGGINGHLFDPLKKGVTNIGRLLDRVKNAAARSGGQPSEDDGHVDEYTDDNSKAGGNNGQLFDTLKKGANNIGRLFDRVKNASARSGSQPSEDDGHVDEYTDDNRNVGGNRGQLIDRLKKGATNIGRLFDRVKNAAPRSGGQQSVDDGHVDEYTEGNRNVKGNNRQLFDTLKKGANNIGRIFDHVKNASGRSGGQQSEDDGHVNEYTDDIRNVGGINGQLFGRLKKGATNIGRLFDRVKNASARSGGQQSDDDGHVDEYTDDNSKAGDNNGQLFDTLKKGANNIGRLFDRVKNASARSGSQPSEDDGHEDEYPDDNRNVGGNNGQLFDTLKKGANNIGRIFDHVKNASGRSGGQQSEDDGHVNEYTDDIRNVGGINGQLFGRLKKGATNIGRLFDRVKNASARSGGQQSDDDGHVDEYTDDNSKAGDNNGQLFDTLKKGANNIGRLFDRVKNASARSGSQPSEDDGHEDEYTDDNRNVGGNNGQLFDRLKKGATNIGRLFDRVKNAAARSGGQQSDDDGHVDEYTDDNSKAGGNNGQLLDTLKKGATNIGRLFDRVKIAAARSGGQQSDDDGHVDEYTDDNRNVGDNNGQLFDTLKKGANNIGRLFDRVKNAAPRSGGQQSVDDGHVDEYTEGNRNVKGNNGQLFDTLKKGANNIDRIFDRVKNASGRSGGQQSEDDGHVNEYTDDIRNVGGINGQLFGRLKKGATNIGRLFDRVKNASARSGGQQSDDDGHVDEYTDDNSKAGDNNGQLFDTLKKGANNIRRLFDRVKNASARSGSQPSEDDGHEDEYTDDNRNVGGNNGQLFDRLKKGATNIGRLFDRVKNAAARSGGQQSDDDGHVDEYTDDNRNVGDNNGQLFDTLKKGATNIGRLFDRVKNASARSGGQLCDDDGHVDEYTDDNSKAGGNNGQLFDTLKKGATNIGRLFDRVKNASARSGSQSSEDDGHEDEYTDVNRNVGGNNGQLFDRLKKGATNIGRLFDRVKNAAARSGGQQSDDDAHVDEYTENNSKAGGNNGKLFDTLKKGAKNIGRLYDRVKNASARSGSQVSEDDGHVNEYTDDVRNVGGINGQLFDRLKKGATNIGRLFDRVKNASARSGAQQIDDDGHVYEYTDDVRNAGGNNGQLFDTLKKGANNIGRLFDRVKNASARSGSQPSEDDGHEDEYTDDNKNVGGNNGQLFDRLKKGATNIGRLFDRVKNASGRSGGQQSDDDGHVDEYTDDNRNVGDNNGQLFDTLKKGATNIGRLFDRVKNASARSGGQLCDDDGHVDEYTDDNSNAGGNNGQLFDTLKKGAANIGRLFDRVKNASARSGSQPSEDDGHEDEYTDVNRNVGGNNGQLFDRLKKGATNIGRLFDRVKNAAARSGGQQSDDDAHVDEYTENNSNAGGNNGKLFDTLKKGTKNIGRLYDRVKNASARSGSQVSEDDGHEDEYTDVNRNVGGNNGQLFDRLKKGATNIGRLFDRVKNAAARSGGQQSDDDAHVDEYTENNSKAGGNNGKLFDTLKKGAKNIGRLYDRVKNASARSGSQVSEDDGHVNEYTDDVRNVGGINGQLFDRLKKGATNIGRLFDRVKNASARSGAQQIDDDGHVYEYTDDVRNAGGNNGQLFDTLKKGANNIGRLFDRVKNASARSGSQPSEDDGHEDEYTDDNKNVGGNNGQLFDRLKKGATNIGRLFDRVKNASGRSGGQQSDDDGHVDEYTDDNRNVGDNNGQLFDTLKKGATNIGRLFDRVKNASARSGGQLCDDDGHVDEYTDDNSNAGGNNGQLFDTLKKGATNIGRLFDRVKNASARSGSQPSEDDGHEDEYTDVNRNVGGNNGQLFDRLKKGATNIGRLFDRVKNASGRSGGQQSDDDGHVDEYTDDNRNVGDNNGQLFDTLKKGATNIGRLFDRVKNASARSGGQLCDDDGHVDEYTDDNSNAGGNNGQLFDTLKKGATNIGRLFDRVKNASARSGSQPSEDDGHEDEYTDVNRNVGGNNGQLFDRLKKGATNIGRLFDRVKNAAARSGGQQSDDDAHVDEYTENNSNAGGNNGKLFDTLKKGTKNIGRLYDRVKNASARSGSQVSEDDGNLNEYTDDVRNAGGNNGQLFDTLKKGATNIGRLFDRVKNASARSGGQQSDDDGHVDEYTDDNSKAGGNNGQLFDTLKKGANNIGRLFDRVKNASARGGAQQSDDDGHVDEYTDDIRNAGGNNGQLFDTLKKGATNIGRLFDRVKNASARSGSQLSEDDGHEDEYTDDNRNVGGNNGQLFDRLKKGATNIGRLFDRVKNAAARSGGQQSDDDAHVDEYTENNSNAGGNNGKLFDTLKKGAKNIGRLYDRVKNASARSGSQPSEDDGHEDEYTDDNRNVGGNNGQLFDRLKKGATNIGRLFDRVKNAAARSGSQPSEDDGHVDEYTNNNRNVGGNNGQLFDRLKKGATNIGRLFDRVKNAAARSGGQQSDDDGHVEEYTDDYSKAGGNNGQLFDRLKKGANNIGRLFDRVKNAASRNGVQQSDVDGHAGDHSEDNNRNSGSIRGGGRSASFTVSRNNNEQPNDVNNRASLGPIIIKNNQPDENNNEYETKYSGNNDDGFDHEGLRIDVKKLGGWNIRLDKPWNGVVGRLLNSLDKGSERSDAQIQQNHDENKADHNALGEISNNGHDEIMKSLFKSLAQRNGNFPIGSQWNNRFDFGILKNLLYHTKNSTLRKGNLGELHTNGDHNEYEGSDDGYGGKENGQHENSTTRGGERSASLGLRNSFDGTISLWNKKLNFDGPGNGLLEKLLNKITNRAQRRGGLDVQYTDDDYDENPRYDDGFGDQQNGQDDNDKTSPSRGGGRSSILRNGGNNDNEEDNEINEEENGTLEDNSKNNNNDRYSQNGNNDLDLGSKIGLNSFGHRNIGSKLKNRFNFDRLRNGLTGRLLNHVRSSVQRSSGQEYENHDENREQSDNEEQNNSGNNGGLISGLKNSGLTIGGKLNNRLNNGRLGNGPFGRLLNSIKNGAQRSGILDKGQNYNIIGVQQRSGQKQGGQNSKHICIHC